MGNADPLAACRNVHPADGSTAEEDLPRQHLLNDDALVQEAILRSLEDDNIENCDPELQAAMLQSHIDTKGIAADVAPECVALLEAMLDAMGLRRMDVGSTNMNEGGTVMSNQCFYLAIARSWLADAARGGGLLVRDSALQLKREVDASVLDVRGQAAVKEMGEDSEAYTDFLACAMRGEGVSAGSAIADLAIVIFASATGSLEAYEGRRYAEKPRGQRAANLALVWHRPGHFETVVSADDGGKVDLTLEELLRRAEEEGVPATLVKA